MDNLIAIPHVDGLDILRNKLFEKIKKFSLIDENNNVYFTAQIHSSYIDINKVVTVEIIIPKENNFSVFNKYIRILSEDDKIIANIQTPLIQLVSGIGGVQTIKLAVSGDTAGTIIFKKDEYITWSEADEFFLSNSLSNLRLQAKICEIIIQDKFKKINKGA